MKPRFNPLAQLYKTIDLSWNGVADQYKFQCTGCKDNCCLSLFFHHTHVEKAYLLAGFTRLPRQEQEEILLKAQDYCKTTFDLEGTDLPVSKKRPCPLLTHGRCRLYKFRPMICRMHGLPHELHKPGGQVIKGPGCEAGQFSDQDYIPFDRTPFYRGMAKIEMDFRTDTRINKKIKQTIAQMLLDAGKPALPY